MSCPGSLLIQSLFSSSTEGNSVTMLVQVDKLVGEDPKIHTHRFLSHSLLIPHSLQVAFNPNPQLSAPGPFQQHWSPMPKPGAARKRLVEVRPSPASSAGLYLQSRRNGLTLNVLTAEEEVREERERKGVRGGKETEYGSREAQGKEALRDQRVLRTG